MMSHKGFKQVIIEGKAVRVPYPVEVSDVKLIGRGDILKRAIAAWSAIDGKSPLNFRLYGPPGVGKNAIVYELARLLNKDLYIINGHEELGPEDIACSATMTSRNTIEYVASPLFAAMLNGGICFFDEIGKSPQSALDPLASVLDERRSLTSVLAGIHIKANKGFLFCASLNEDEENGIGLPGFIDERTRPAIHVGYQTSNEMEKIIRSHVPAATEKWISEFISAFGKMELSSRVAITILGYAFRLYASQNGQGEPDKKEINNYLYTAYRDIVKENTSKNIVTAGDNGENIFNQLYEKDTVH